jgi:hypothetical protein
MSAIKVHNIAKAARYNTAAYISHQLNSEHVQCDHDPSSTLVISPMPLLSQENASHQSFVASRLCCKKILSMLQKNLVNATK